MKTPIVRTREMALGWQEYDEALRKFCVDAPTLAGVVISSADAAGEAGSSQASLPPGCVFAVRYVSR
jgi:hypothetical protein